MCVIYVLWTLISVRFWHKSLFIIKFLKMSDLVDYCKWLIRWRNKLGKFLHLKSDLLQFSLNRRSELGLQTLTFTPSFRELKMACISVDYALKLVEMVQTWGVTWWLNTRSLPMKSVYSVIGFFRTVSTLQDIARFAVSILDFLKTYF